MKRVTSAFVVAIVFVLTSCSLFNSGQNLDEKRIDTQTAYEIYKQNISNDSFVVVDVCTAQEYENAHIKSALNFDYKNKEEFIKSLKGLDTNDTILVYCLSGGRSGASLKTFDKLGFKNLYELREGIISWIEAGYPVTN